MNRTLFYILSCTWGAILSCIGLIIISGIKIYGIFAKKSYTLKKCGYCYYLNVGKSWGGLELGMFFITESRDSDSVKWHEHGHAIQNCFWGPLMIFVITLPSAIRYWYREFKFYRRGLTPPTMYSSIWFEKQADQLGRIYRKALEHGKT